MGSYSIVEAGVILAFEIDELSFNG